MHHAQNPRWWFRTTESTTTAGRTTLGPTTTAGSERRWLARRRRRLSFTTTSLRISPASSTAETCGFLCCFLCCFPLPRAFENIVSMDSTIHQQGAISFRAAKADSIHNRCPQGMYFDSSSNAMQAHHNLIYNVSGGLMQWNTKDHSPMLRHAQTSERARSLPLSLLLSNVADTAMCARFPFVAVSGCPLADRLHERE